MFADAAKPVPTPKQQIAPEPVARISDKARARLWRAIADMHVAVAKKQAAEAAILEECGSGAILLDQDGEPQCAPKPKE